MAELSLRWVDARNARRFEEAAAMLGSEKLAGVQMRAVNRAGNAGRTAAGRALAGQTGLPARYVRGRLIKGTKRAAGGRLVYAIDAKGGPIPLKFFKPRETRKGVSAAPFGKRQVFEHTFMKAGRFPKRVAFNGGGHVFMPDLGSRKWGRSMEVEFSDVVFPSEMVSGASAAAWERVGLPTLEKRISHELKRASGGVLS
ncbi:phage tail protein [Afifella sp. H1R]|uniref:phage tail protein n=1 Tax=Afifella sp. H1R TaxID=2908841 RepID=UPI001F46F5EC|nr:phage tail protein [Afifella sp. H1R]MCF1502922.1 phage tail protein [Afifella sp. H1R]